MKQLTIALISLMLCGCGSALAIDACLGTVDVPVEFARQFQPVVDDTLLNSALGEPNTGALCQGRVYVVSFDEGGVTTVYRAWNSTNPASRFGKWWAFYRPSGKVSQYRSDYEICYQWSPLDKLTQCKLKAGTKVVVGTGQSATCSQYLAYPVSAAKQIYLDNSSALYDCEDFDLVFSWQ